MLQYERKTRSQQTEEKLQQLEGELTRYTNKKWDMRKQFRKQKKGLKIAILRDTWEECAFMKQKQGTIK